MAATGVEIYRFRADVLRDAAARTRRRLLASLIAVAAVVVVVWATALRPRGSGAGTVIFSVALLLLLALFSLRRRLRRLHARWASFEVTLAPDAVIRTVEGFPPIRIARGEVASLGEVDAGLVVRDRAGTALLVPREVDGYARLRERLAAWRTGDAEAP